MDGEKLADPLAGATGGLEGPSRQALAYPFPWPEGPCVLVSGRLYRLEEYVVGDPLRSQVAGHGPLCDVLDSLGFKRQAGLGFTTLLASGSNGAPGRLWAKLDGRVRLPIAFFLPGVIRDLVSVYSCHFASYGAVPATVCRYPGARARLIALVVPDEAVPVIHASEAVGRNYGYFQLATGGVELDDGQRLDRPFAYLSLRGLFAPGGSPCQLEARRDARCSWPALDQPGVLEMAMTLLGVGGGVERFAASIASDAGLRERHMAGLAACARAEIDHAGWRRLL